MRPTTHEQRVAVEQTACYPVRLVNHGANDLALEVRVEGIPPHWATLSPARLTLAAGSTVTVTLTVTPPRMSSCTAGVYPLTLSVVASCAAPRVSELSLILDPYDAFSALLCPPASGQEGWVQVSNQGNRPLSLRLTGHAAGGTLRFEPPDAGAGNVAALHLLPGATASVAVRLVVARGLRSPWGTRRLPFRVDITPAHDAALQQSVFGEALTPRSVVPPRLAWAVVVLALLLGGVWLVMGKRPAAHAGNQGRRTEGAGEIALLYRPFPVGRLPVVIESRWSAPLPSPIPLPSLVAPPNMLPTVPAAPPPAEAATMLLAPVPTPALTVEGPRAVWDHEAMFREVGAQYGLDWRLLASLAYRESRLDASAVGGSGEQGLMQILPATWAQVAPGVGVTDPFDPYSNVRVGAAYLAYLRGYLRSLGHAEEYWMLVAYNWGPDNVRKLLQAGGGWGEVPTRRQDYAYTILQEVATPSGAWWHEALKAVVYPD